MGRMGSKERGGMMGFWQWVVVVLWALDLLSTARFHGQKQPNYNFYSSLSEVLLAFIILYFGGFFK